MTKSSSFEISNLLKSIAALFCTYRDFPLTNCFVLFPNLGWYAARLNSLHIIEVMILKDKNLEKYESWFAWFLIGKKKSGTKFWVISFVELSLQQFYLTEEKLKTFYNLKVIPMKVLEARSDTGWFGWIQL